jgi:hypothetical protein
MKATASGSTSAFEARACYLRDVIAKTWALPVEEGVARGPVNFVRAFDRLRMPRATPDPFEGFTR